MSFRQFEVVLEGALTSRRNQKCGIKQDSIIKSGHSYKEGCPDLFLLLYAIFISHK